MAFKLKPVKTTTLALYKHLSDTVVLETEFLNQKKLFCDTL